MVLRKLQVWPAAPWASPIAAYAAKGFGLAKPVKRSGFKQSQQLILQQDKGLTRVAGSVPQEEHLYLRRSNTVLPEQVLAAYVGPISLIDVPGSGRGLVLTQSVTAGQLLLICEPLAAIWGPAGSNLQPAELVPQLQPAVCTGMQRCALEFLYSGNDATSHTLMDVHQLAACSSATGGSVSSGEPGPQLQDSGSSSGTHSTADSGYSSSHGHIENKDVNRQQAMATDVSMNARLLQTARLNAYGEPYGDMAAWASRGQSPARSAFIGLWPAHAMLNHSCAPNASCLVLSRSTPSAAQDGASMHGSGAGSNIDNAPKSLTRDRSSSLRSTFAGGTDSRHTAMMVVRASREATTGAEVTISYTDAAAPLAVRQKQLHSAWGFTCSCARCQAELACSPGLVEQLEQMYTKVVTARPAILRALERQDGTAVEANARLLQQMLTTGWKSVAAAHVSDQVSKWLLCGLYPLLSLLSMCVNHLAEKHANSNSPSSKHSSSSGTGSRLGAMPADVFAGRSTAATAAVVAGTTAAASPTSNTRTSACPWLETVLTATKGSWADMQRILLTTRIELLRESAGGSYEHARLSAQLLDIVSETTQAQAGAQGNDTKKHRGSTIQGEALSWPATADDVLATAVAAHLSRYGNNLQPAELSRLIAGHTEGAAALADAMAEMQAERLKGGAVAPTRTGGRRRGTGFRGRRGISSAAELLVADENDSL